MTNFLGSLAVGALLLSTPAEAQWLAWPTNSNPNVVFEVFRGFSPTNLTVIATTTNTQFLDRSAPIGVPVYYSVRTMWVGTNSVIFGRMGPIVEGIRCPDPVDVSFYWCDFFKPPGWHNPNAVDP